MDDSAAVGLTTAEVEERAERGQTNAAREVSSRSYWHIIRANVFTRFNAILGTLFVVILLFGQLRDGLFGLVILVNTCLLYTSDAADDLLCVDLGGRRI